MPNNRKSKGKKSQQKVGDKENDPPQVNGKNSVKNEANVTKETPIVAMKQETRVVEKTPSVVVDGPPNDSVAKDEKPTDEKKKTALAKDSTPQKESSPTANKTSPKADASSDTTEKNPCTGQQASAQKETLPQDVTQEESTKSSTKESMVSPGLNPTKKSTKEGENGELDDNSGLNGADAAGEWWEKDSLDSEEEAALEIAKRHGSIPALNEIDTMELINQHLEREIMDSPPVKKKKSKKSVITPMPSREERKSMKKAKQKEEKKSKRISAQNSNVNTNPIQDLLNRLSSAGAPILNESGDYVFPKLMTPDGNVISSGNPMVVNGNYSMSGATNGMMGSTATTMSRTDDFSAMNMNSLIQSADGLALGSHGPPGMQSLGQSMSAANVMGNVMGGLKGSKSLNNPPNSARESGMMHFPNRTYSGTNLGLGGRSSGFSQASPSGQSVTNVKKRKKLSGSEQKKLRQQKSSRQDLLKEAHEKQIERQNSLIQPTVMNPMSPYLDRTTGLDRVGLDRISGMNRSGGSGLDRSTGSQELRELGVSQDYSNPEETVEFKIEGKSSTKVDRRNSKDDLEREIKERLSESQERAKSSAKVSVPKLELGKISQTTGEEVGLNRASTQTRRTSNGGNEETQDETVVELTEAEKKLSAMVEKAEQSDSDASVTPRGVPVGGDSKSVDEQEIGKQFGASDEQTRIENKKSEVIVPPKAAGHVRTSIPAPGTVKNKICAQEQMLSEIGNSAACIAKKPSSILTKIKEDIAQEEERKKQARENDKKAALALMNATLSRKSFTIEEKEQSPFAVNSPDSTKDKEGSSPKIADAKESVIVDPTPSDNLPASRGPSVKTSVVSDASVGSTKPPEKKESLLLASMRAASAKNSSAKNSANSETAKTSVVANITAGKTSVATEAERNITAKLSEVSAAGKVSVSVAPSSITSGTVSTGKVSAMVSAVESTPKSSFKESQTDSESPKIEITGKADSITEKEGVSESNESPEITLTTPLKNSPKRLSKTSASGFKSGSKTTGSVTTPNKPTSAIDPKTLLTDSEPKKKRCFCC